MVEYDISTTIRSSPAEVFAVLADIQDYARHDLGDQRAPVLSMVKAPPGPTRVGTRWREVVRLGPGLAMTVWSEVTAIERDRRLELVFRGAFVRGGLTYVLEPHVDITRLRQRGDMRLRWLPSLFARPLERVYLARIAARLEVLRALIEGEVAPRPAA